MTWNGELGNPELVSEEDCVFNFKWKTHLACGAGNIPISDGSDSHGPIKATDCTYESSSRKFDLSPLAKTNEGDNWELVPSNNTFDDIYLINICKPLQPSSLNRCPPETNICGVQKDPSQRSRVLGKHGILVWESDQLILRYVDGDRCPDATPRNTDIRFSCGKDLGQPKLTGGQKACGRTIFDWETSAACNLYDRKGTSAGMIVFWVFFSLILGYFFFKSLFRKFIQGYDGLDVIPHIKVFEKAWEFLSTILGFLVNGIIDGFLWIRMKLRKDSHGHIRL